MLKSRLNSRSAHNKGNTKAKIRHKNSTNPRKQNTKRTKTIWKEKQYKEYQDKSPKPRKSTEKVI